MKDQIPTGDSFPPNGLDASGGDLTEKQKLAASIERDFRSLLDALRFSQAIADPSVASQIDRLKAVVERGIDLSLRLKNMTSSERKAG